MKAHLFYTILFLFIITAIVTILGITKVIIIDEFYLKGLFASLLLELVGAVIGLYQKADFFEDGSSKKNSMENEEIKIYSVNKNDNEVLVPSFNEKIVLERNSMDLIEVNPKAINHLSSLTEFLETPKKFREHINEEEMKFPLFEVDKKKIMSRYNGVQVTWDLIVSQLKKIDDENIEVVADAEGTIVSVYSGAIKVDENPELRFLKKGQKIKMIGVLSVIDFPMRIELKNTVVHYVSE